MSERRVRWGERKRMARNAVAVCAVLLVGCGGDQGPAPIDAQGAWSGTIQGSGSPAQLQLTLTETNGVVAGSGSIASSSDAVALQVAGNYTQPNLSLTLSSAGFNDINLTTTVTAAQIQGSANGSGYVNAVVSLTRQ